MREGAGQPTENKLILLYTIGSKQQVSDVELSDFMMFHGYMDYFVMQTMLKELEESELLIKNENQYSLTHEGNQVLTTFMNRIPNSIRQDITEYAKTSVYSKASLLETEAKVISDRGGYEVECRILDYDRTLFLLRVSAKTEEDAWRIHHQWMENGMTLYRSILSSFS